ncbi:MAG: hypothetical protein HUJ98_10690, partial [Bacteroidaceae bacterium]|nr:hypothetical protein [Bacteroidaceae bacterium]
MAGMLLATLHIQATPEVVNLKVQGVVCPLTIEDTHPLFSWQMSSKERGAKQNAYQIVVRREPDNSVVWNTGKVVSSVSDNIKYLGVALQAETAYSWDLTVWDEKW